MGILYCLQMTHIFVSGKNEEDVYEKTRTVLNQVHEYTATNQLHIISIYAL